MIANFFRSLNQRRVEYLLISGQAAVLYGAATFSELDVMGAPPRVGRFASALCEQIVRSPNKVFDRFGAFGLIEPFPS